MSEFFIKRPSFAWVVALFISLAGLLVISKLPVAQYPNAAPPQITIATTHPGASAKVLVDSVTSVLRESLNDVRGLLYSESTNNSSGSAEIVTTFEPGIDSDLAQIDVQNRLRKAEARMPQTVLTQGPQVKQTSAGSPPIYTLSYKKDVQRSDTTTLSDYAAHDINNELRHLPGVGRLQFFSSEAVMRVWIDPQKLVGFGFPVDDVSNAIRGQNVQVPADAFGSAPGSSAQELTATLATKSTLSDPQEFGQVMLHANEDSSLARLTDIARLELGKESYDISSRLSSTPTVGGAIQLSPGANAIQTATLVKQCLAGLSAFFPEDMQYNVPYDTSRFVGVAIRRMIHILIEAMVLVLLVMFLFLQNICYTLISSIVVPVCLLGMLMMIYLLGFSVNMMTMFGMVLAIGILVDGAIVVVESVERVVAEEGISPAEATAKAVKQVSGAIVGITPVLSAVFLPLAFMVGSMGVIYQQFSVSLAVSILSSGFLALTLTPALCATLLRPIPEGHRKKRDFFGAFNRGFARVTKRYSLLNSKLVAHAGRFMLVYVGLVAMLGYFYLRLPGASMSAEDLGYTVIDMRLPPGTSCVRTDAAGKELERFLKLREAVASVFLVSDFSFSGQGGNVALAFPTFKGWSGRGAEQPTAAEIAALNEHFTLPDDGTIIAVSPPPIDGLGSSGGFALRLMDRGGVGHEALLQTHDTLLGEVQTNPKFLYTMMEGLTETPQLHLLTDREKARALEVSFETISGTLSAAPGSRVINGFINAGRQQRVMIQAEQGNRMTPEDVFELYVPNAAGSLVSLSASISMK